MELESYLELFDKYECSEWVVGQMLGGSFAMAVFIIILITFCINFTIYFIDFIKSKVEVSKCEEENEDL